MKKKESSILRDFKTLMARPEESDENLIVDSLLPFRHDPVPEHQFDESEFSLHTSETIY